MTEDTPPPEYIIVESDYDPGEGHGGRLGIWKQNWDTPRAYDAIFIGWSWPARDAEIRELVRLASKGHELERQERERDRR